MEAEGSVRDGIIDLVFSRVRLAQAVVILGARFVRAGNCGLIFLLGLAEFGRIRSHQSFRRPLQMYHAERRMEIRPKGSLAFVVSIISFVRLLGNLLDKLKRLVGVCFGFSQLFIFVPTLQGLRSGKQCGGDDQTHQGI